MSQEEKINSILDRIPPPDLRRHGALQLASLILSVMGLALPDKLTKAIILAMEDELEKQGFQILTDQMRAECGMKPVGEHGWTIEEMLAWEEIRLNSLRKIITAPSDVGVQFDDDYTGRIVAVKKHDEDPGERLERMARAMAESEGDLLGGDWPGNITKQLWYGRAEVAIKAYELGPR